LGWSKHQKTALAKLPDVLEWLVEKIDGCVVQQLPLKEEKGKKEHTREKRSRKMCKKKRKGIDGASWEAATWV
jgi:hypothetical protein